ncbi:MAG: hypothetical protein AAF608_05110 [Pseudomonadota bacterium]
MGRRDLAGDTAAALRLRIEDVVLDQGYDPGGAYWGERPKGQTLYRIVSPCGSVELFRDGASHSEVERELKETYTSATFFHYTTPLWLVSYECPKGCFDPMHETGLDVVLAPDARPHCETCGEPIPDDHILSVEEYTR